MRTGAWRGKRTAHAGPRDQVVLAAGTLRHPAAAARHADTGALPRPLAAAGPPDPHQLRGAARPRPAPRRARRLQPGRGDHRRRSTPTSTPTSSRCATARAATPWACCRPCWSTAAARLPRPAEGARRDRAPPGWRSCRSLSVRRWSERTIIALVMQSRDNCSSSRGRRGPARRPALTSRPGPGEPNPTWIPRGHEAVRRIADDHRRRPGRRVRRAWSTSR